MATPYLAITDGTTTCTFLNDTTPQTYFVQSGEWTPAIAGLKRNPFAANGAYLDVDEEINCLIRGSSATDCYAKLETLTLLLDQAERWEDGQKVSAVLLKFAPTGSAVSSDSTPLTAVILGRADGDETNSVVLSPEWDQAARAFVLPCRIRFRRRGLWLLGGEATGESSSSNNPVVRTRTFGASITTKSPIQISIGGFTPAKAPTITAGYILVTNDADKIAITDVSAKTASGYTTVNDSAQKPLQGTNILRYTPIDAAEKESGTIDTILPYGSTYGIGITGFFVLLRNNSASISFKVRMRVVFGGVAYYTNPIIVDTSSTSPRWMYANVVSIRNVGTSQTTPSVGLAVTAIGYTSGTHTLDFSAIAQLNLDDECSRVIATQDVTNGGNFPLTTTPIYLSVYDRYNTAPTPAVQVTDATGVTVGVSYTGNVALASDGDTVAVAWLSCNQGYWRFVDNAAALLPVTLAAERSTAYITPR